MDKILQEFGEAGGGALTDGGKEAVADVVDDLSGGDGFAGLLFELFTLGADVEDLLLEVLHLCAVEVVEGVAVCDDFIEAFKGLAGLRLLLLQGGNLHPCVADKGVVLLLDFLGEPEEQVFVVDDCGKALDDEVFEGGRVDVAVRTFRVAMVGLLTAAVVFTDLLLARAGARAGHAGTAFAAVDEAGEQVRIFRRTPAATPPVFLHALMHSLEEFGADDGRAAVRHDDHAVMVRAVAVAPAVKIRLILAEDAGADVAPVVEHVMERGLAELSPAPRAVAAGVDLPQDVDVGRPGGVALEDVADGHGLLLIDDVLLVLVHAVPEERAAAGDLASQHILLQALLDLTREVARVVRGEADELVFHQGTFGARAVEGLPRVFDADIVPGKLLLVLVVVEFIAAVAVYLMEDHDFEESRRGVAQHLPIGRAVVVRTGIRFVGVLFDDVVAFAAAVFAARADLRHDAFGPLAVGRVAGVECSNHKITSYMACKPSPHVVSCKWISSQGGPQGFQQSSIGQDGAYFIVAASSGGASPTGGAFLFCGSSNSGRGRRWGTPFVPELLPHCVERCLFTLTVALLWAFLGSQAGGKLLRHREKRLPFFGREAEVSLQQAHFEVRQVHLLLQAREHRADIIALHRPRTRAQPLLRHVERLADQPDVLINDSIAVLLDFTYASLSHANLLPKLTLIHT